MAEKVIKDAMLQKAVEQAVMELVRFEHGRDQSVIHLPIWLPNGTGITVTVRRTGSLVEVSDDGAAYGEAEDAMMHKSFARNAPDFATPLGVTYEAKAFSIRDVSLDNIAGAVAMVAEAAKRTFDVTVERAAERKTAEVNEVFYDRLRSVFREATVVRDCVIRGASQHEWKFSNVVSFGDRRTIFEAVAPFHISIYSVVTKFQDVRHLDNAPARYSVVQNNDEMTDLIGVLAQVSNVIEARIPDSSLRKLAS